MKAGLVKVPALPRTRSVVYRPRMVRLHTRTMRVVHRVFGCPGAAYSTPCETCQKK